jgi:hypothetical protein
LLEKNDDPKPVQETPLSGTNSPNNRSFYQKLCDQIYRIYRWDENFLYSSMAISTYTVNFIILYHLTCAFSFLYTTRMMSPISFMTNIFEQILSIGQLIYFHLNYFCFFSLEIKDRVFHVEIIVSAIITAFIYGIQLFLGMKNFREHVVNYRALDEKILRDNKGISFEEVPSKSIQYPGYLLRYTIGGFVITFHLLIFVTVIPRLFFRYPYAFKWILEFISPLLIFYVLQWLIARDISGFMNIDTPGNAESTRIDRSQWKKYLKNILQYFILVASKIL